MRARALLLDAVMALLVASCAGATRANEHVGGATVAGALAGIGGLFGAVWAAVGGFFGALWASLTGEERAEPWQLTLGVQAVTWAGVSVVVAVIVANRLEWLPAWFRKKSEPGGVGGGGGQ